MTIFFHLTDVFNVAELYALAGTPVERISCDTEVIVTDKNVSQLSSRWIEEMPEKYDHIHSYDFEKMLKLLTS